MASKLTRPLIKAAQIRQKHCFLIDCDGVLYHQSKVLKGALEFVNWLQKENKKYLFLTNSSERSPRELQEKLNRYGIHTNQQSFYTSALSTADFLARQRPNGSAYVIGEPGLMAALYERGYSFVPFFLFWGQTQSRPIFSHRDAQPVSMMSILIMLWSARHQIITMHRSKKQCIWFDAVLV